MPKNIIVTEKQYRKLQEEIDNEFSYISDDDTKPCDALVNVSADGKTDLATNGKPVTSDEVQQSLTPQSYNRYRMYGNAYPHYMREGVKVNNSEDFYDTEGFSDNDELNTLTDGDENDDIARIPQGVEQKLDIFLNSVKQEKLNEKQQAILLNKIIQSLNIDTVSNQWKKELINELQ